MAITQVNTPNFTTGREGTAVDRIVIHYISGTLAAADATFGNASSQVSAHYGIEDDVVHQFVAEGDTAWHAGNWEMNLRSIGIEHSADASRPPSQATYNQSIAICTRICQEHGLDPQTQIIPHNSVVATQCPGTVNIQTIRDGVAASL